MTYQERRVGIVRPPNLRLANGTANAPRCHNCVHMGLQTGVCWRYVYPVKRNELCDKWRRRSR